MAERGIKKPRKPKESEFGKDIRAYVDAMLDYEEKKTEYRKMKPESVSEDDSSWDSSYSYSARPGNVIPQEVAPAQQAKADNQSDDANKKNYLQNNGKVQDYDLLSFELLYFLSDHLPGIKVNEEVPPLELAQMVKDVITDYQTKFNKFNLELKEISGHEVAGYIKNHHRKVMEVVEDYEEKIKAANDEIAQCKSQIAHLGAELTAALTKMQYLEMGTAFYGGFEDSMSQEQFMADLQGRVAQCASLSSSMAVELQHQQEENRGLKQQLAFLARQSVETEEKCMQEIVDFSKRSDLCAKMESALEDMIKEEVEPNKEVCQDMVNQWKKEINEAIDENSKEIDELFKRYESQEKEKADLVANTKQLEEELEKLRNEIKHSKSLSENFKDEISNLKNINDVLEKEFEELEQRYLQNRRNEESFYSRDGSDLMGNFSTFDRTPPRPHPSPPLSSKPMHLDSQTAPMPHPLSSRVMNLDQLLPDTAQAPAMPATPYNISEQWNGSSEWSNTFGHPRTGQSSTPKWAGAYPPRLDVSSIRAPAPSSRTSQRPTSRSPTVSTYGETLPRPPPLSSRAMNLDQLLPGAAQAPEAPSNVRTSQRPASRTPTRMYPPGGMPLSTPRAGRPGGRLGMTPVTPRATVAPRQGIRPAGTRAGTPPRPRVPAQQPAAPRMGQSQKSRIQRPTGQRSAIPAPRSAAPRTGASQRTGTAAPRATGSRTRTPQRSGMQPTDATPAGGFGARAMNLDQLLAGTAQAQGLNSRMMMLSPLQAEPMSSRVVLLSPLREPLPFDVDVTAQDIVPSNDGEQFTSQVVHEVAPGLERQNTRRARRPRPTFTPKFGFQR